MPTSRGIVFIASLKRVTASSDSKTSKTRKPSSVCAVAWTKRPSNGRSEGESRRLLPFVSRQTTSSYRSWVRLGHGGSQRPGADATPLDVDRRPRGYDGRSPRFKRKPGARPQGAAYARH